MDATNTTRQRYPLAWPSGWPRTPAAKRQRATFQKSVTTRWVENGASKQRTTEKALAVIDAVQRLEAQLDYLGVREDARILSTNIALRMDGRPRSDQDPADVGVAVYFQLKRADRVLACDKWTRVADNIAALAQHIDAIRRIDRYGVGTLEQAFAGYEALPSKGQTWKTTLGFPVEAAPTEDEIQAAFRARAREAHPDKEGGSHDAMASLTVARDEGLATTR